MFLKDVFRKLKNGITRAQACSLPVEGERKHYGNDGERSFASQLGSCLPDCRIKQNVCLESGHGTAEIDCLILYENKMFAVEIKRWKGTVTESDGLFIQSKTDPYTGEIYTEFRKSPFGQLSRAIGILKDLSPERLWINDVVCFESSDSVSVRSDRVWFCNVRELAEYIKNKGRTSDPHALQALFDSCSSADVIYPKNSIFSLRCTVSDNSLRFVAPEGTFSRKDIKRIDIEHHFSYDVLVVSLRSGATVRHVSELGTFEIVYNGTKRTYMFAKINAIIPGD